MPNMERVSNMFMTEVQILKKNLKEQKELVRYCGLWQCICPTHQLQVFNNNRSKRFS